MFENVGFGAANGRAGAEGGCFVVAACCQYPTLIPVCLVLATVSVVFDFVSVRCFPGNIYIYVGSGLCSGMGMIRTMVPDLGICVVPYFAVLRTCALSTKGCNWHPRQRGYNCKPLLAHLQQGRMSPQHQKRTPVSYFVFGCMSQLSTTRSIRRTWTMGKMFRNVQ